MFQQQPGVARTTSRPGTTLLAPIQVSCSFVEQEHPQPLPTLHPPPQSHKGLGPGLLPRGLLHGPLLLGGRREAGAGDLGKGGGGGRVMVSGGLGLCVLLASEWRRLHFVDHDYEKATIGLSLWKVQVTHLGLGGILHLNCPLVTSITTSSHPGTPPPLHSMSWGFVLAPRARTRRRGTQQSTEAGTGTGRGLAQSWTGGARCQLPVVLKMTCCLPGGLWAC